MKKPTRVNHPTRASGGGHGGGDDGVDEMDIGDSMREVGGEDEPQSIAEVRRNLTEIRKMWRNAPDEPFFTSAPLGGDRTPAVNSNTTTATTVSAFAFQFVMSHHQKRKQGGGGGVD